jgi:hypothetical protein
LALFMLVAGRLTFARLWQSVACAGAPHKATTQNNSVYERGRKDRCIAGTDDINAQSEPAFLPCDASGLRAIRRAEFAYGFR